MKYAGYTLPALFRRAKIADKVKENAIYYIYYTIQDSETIDIVAYKLYKDPNLFWVIAMTNNILDTQFDWPLSSNELDKVVIRKYGATKTQDAHHYETTSQDVLGAGIVVDSDYSGYKQAVTNYEYEQKLNDAKRKIKIIKPQYLGIVLSEFKSKIVK